MHRVAWSLFVVLLLAALGVPSIAQERNLRRRMTARPP